MYIKKHEIKKAYKSIVILFLLVFYVCPEIQYGIYIMRM
jgi:hypothetical protein